MWANFEQRGEGMDRRELLKMAGLGSVGVVALPFLAETAEATDTQSGFHFVSLSQANTVDGVAHRFFMGGDGHISPGQVVGGGMFFHADANTPVPRTLLAWGSWKATRLIEYHPIGTYGSQGAGFVDLEINLVRDYPSPAVIPAMLEVVCNSGFAGLSNPGKEEGFYLEIPGTIFVEGGAGGPFEPAGLGISTFSVVNEQRN
jgi:hypothetical protein